MMSLVSLATEKARNLPTSSDWMGWTCQEMRSDNVSCSVYEDNSGYCRFLKDITLDCSQHHGCPEQLSCRGSFVDSFVNHVPFSSSESLLIQLIQCKKKQHLKCCYIRLNRGSESYMMFCMSGAYKWTSQPPCLAASLWESLSVWPRLNKKRTIVFFFAICLRK
jgi:hypothetical protein